MKTPKNFETLYTEEQIQKMVSRVAKEIDQSYPPDDELLCVGILKGAWVFLADLVRALERPLQIDFIRAASYGAGTQSSGEVKILKDTETDFSGKHVLLVEEIIDTGRTLSHVKRLFEGRGAKSVKIASLLDKKECREVELEADFVGCTVPNKFLVGYGLDWAENYRSLNCIAVVPQDG